MSTNFTKIHVISDIFFRFNERVFEEEEIPDVDLVIINGNIGALKRNMLYTETLCKKYPDIQFIYNLGNSEEHEALNKSNDEMSLALWIRSENSHHWPKNLHYPILNSKIITCKNGESFDIFCLHGFPKINSYEGEWTKTLWGKYYFSGYSVDQDPTGKYYKPKETSFVNHGPLPVLSTPDYINNQHYLEETKLKNWKATNTSYRKLLVTHINPFNDSRITNQNISYYSLDFTGDIWIGSNTYCDGVDFLGAKLYSNPGRGISRQKIFVV